MTGTAEASASVCALSSKFTSEYMREFHGLQTGVEATGQIDIGAASANAKISVGLLDKDGKFNPALALEAGAEAALLKLSGSVGAKLLGVGFNAQASFLIGAAAKVSAEFENWKLSIDCAAALGIGFSFKLEIDFSNMKEEVTKMVLDKGAKIKDKVLDALIRKGYAGNSTQFYKLMENDINKYFSENRELFPGISSLDVEKAFT